MSDILCKEFKGWFKSFTKSEILLSALQAVLLIVFFAFSTFFILHLLACGNSKLKHGSQDLSFAEQLYVNNMEKEKTVDDVETKKKGYKKHFITTDNGTLTYITANSKTTNQHAHKKVDNTSALASSLKNGITCTWQLSQKTEAITHYYEIITNTKAHSNAIQPATDNHGVQFDLQSYEPDHSKLIGDDLLEDTSENEDSKYTYKGVLTALIKIRPPLDLTFGCTLTVISGYWTLTAASCIEAIEEVESLDSFVMMKNYEGEYQGVLHHQVSDIIIHPQYQGVNMTYDLAALKSEDNLLERTSFFVTLPTVMDYFLITIGERLTMLGYGTLGGAEGRGGGRAALAARAHVVPPPRCARDGWAPRQLRGGRALRAAGCGSAPLCAAVLRAGSFPCAYCAGTPLFRRRLLVGIMSDGRPCGLACGPALFVNLALARDWLDSLLYSD